MLFRSIGLERFVSALAAATTVIVDRLTRFIDRNVYILCVTPDVCDGVLLCATGRSMLVNTVLYSHGFDFCMKHSKDSHPFWYPKT